jgi:hypothetical protein
MLNKLIKGKILRPLKRKLFFFLVALFFTLQGDRASDTKKLKHTLCKMGGRGSNKIRLVASAGAKNRRGLPPEQAEKPMNKIIILISFNLKSRYGIFSFLVRFSQVGYFFSSCFLSTALIFLHK